MNNRNIILQLTGLFHRAIESSGQQLDPGREACFFMNEVYGGEGNLVFHAGHLGMGTGELFTIHETRAEAENHLIEQIVSLIKVECEKQTVGNRKELRSILAEAELLHAQKQGLFRKQGESEKVLNLFR